MDHDTIDLMRLKEDIAAPAATIRKWAATRQRIDDSADKDDREQLVY